MDSGDKEKKVPPENNSNIRQIQNVQSVTAFFALVKDILNMLKGKWIRRVEVSSYDLGMWGQNYPRHSGLMLHRKSSF
jgi:hypothetical protein